MFGSEKIGLTKKDVLNAGVNELSLWHFYIPSFKRVGKAFSSDLRHDKIPSCSIYRSGDKYVYYDFRDRLRLDLFGYLMLKFNKSFPDVLKMINGSIEYQEVPKVEIPKVTSKTEIKVKVRRYNQIDRDFWRTYGITVNTLAEYKVLPITYYWINDYMFRCLTQSYAFEHDNRFKIYRPFDLENKWYSNLTRDDYSGYNQLNWLGEKLIITSSLKDVMVFRELGYDAISSQSEVPDIDSSFIEKLKKRFTNIFINYDNDETGILNSEKLTEKYGFPRFFVPGKDISDFVRDNSLKEAQKLIKQVFNE